MNVGKHSFVSADNSLDGLQLHALIFDHGLDDLQTIIHSADICLQTAQPPFYVWNFLHIFQDGPQLIAQDLTENLALFIVAQTLHRATMMRRAAGFGKVFCTYLMKS